MDKMKKLCIIWGIIMVLIVGGLTAFGFYVKDKTKVYKELEEEIRLASQKLDAQFLHEEKEFKITVDELIEEGLIEDKLKVNEEECDGYAYVTYNGMVYNFKGYVKCPQYTTKGYKE